jgi:hypothetical protein
MKLYDEEETPMDRTVVLCSLVATVLLLIAVAFGFYFSIRSSLRGTKLALAELEAKIASAESMNSKVVDYAKRLKTDNPSLYDLVSISPSKEESPFPRIEQQRDSPPWASGWRRGTR